MTREEYLNELKSSIMSLTSDEQAEAIQYYSDYFDEADDDEKVMRELGTPEELAKTIIEKFANALVDTKKDSGSGKNDSAEEEDGNPAGCSIDALYFEFNKSEVKNLVAHGWNDEGVKFYSATNRYYPLYREYNPNAFANNHNYTGSVLENTWLVSLGWKAEGVKLYAVELDNATIQSASSEAAEEGNYEENSQWGL